jgi:hypothetical protein
MFPTHMLDTDMIQKVGAADYAGEERIGADGLRGKGRGLRGDETPWSARERSYFRLPPPHSLLPHGRGGGADGPPVRLTAGPPGGEVGGGRVPQMNATVY